MHTRFAAFPVFLFVVALFFPSQATPVFAATMPPGMNCACVQADGTTVDSSSFEDTQKLCNAQCAGRPKFQYGVTATPLATVPNANYDATYGGAASGVCTGTCQVGTTCTGGLTQQPGTCTSASQICCGAGTGAGAGGGSVGSVSFTNPLNFSTVQEATGVFLAAFQGIIVWLSLLFIVLGGIFYITSAGDEKKIGTAKKMITAAMIGLAIGVAAPSFLKVIGDVLGWGGAQVPTEVSSAKSMVQIIQGVLNFLLGISGLLAMIMLVIGGFMFFASAGDEKRAETAKSLVKYSIMGIAVVVLSLIIIRTIAMLLSGTA
ncbi:MAG: pilin [Candidatus Moraniibacteriota bacterium]